ncbi:MAG: hypothetical protein KA715_11930 [Xanthomonadaceae bacterium]|nr:hypothetical protein [Xanthomonadaceae bacterium]
MKHLFITDPYDSLAPYREDTSLRLIEASHSSGNDCYLSSYLSISLESQSLTAEVFECQSNPTNRIVISNPKRMSLSDFDEIHYRVDPPVDIRYLAPLQLMRTALSPSVQKLIYNPIDELCTLNEKSIALLIPGAAPRMLVSSNWDELYRFGKQEKKTVLKPLNGFQSRGVDILGWKNEIEQKMSQLSVQKLSENFTIPVVLQEYLPEITNGEIRVWYVRGQTIAAVRRHPPKGEFKINPNVKSKLTRESISSIPASQNIAVQKFLVEHGIHFAAVDWIGNKISDFNITSPGLLVEMEEVLGQDLAKLCF